MTTVATLWVKLGLDQKGYASGLESAAAKTRAVGQGMMKTGAMMTAGITLPVVMAGKSMVDAAVNIQESANAVNKVFEGSSDVIHDYGKTVAETAGLSTADFNQMAAQTGAMLQNLGYDSDEAASKTILLTERAADMASIFNTDVITALNAIQSGLKGEFNPLEQFAVTMKQSTVTSKAMAMGLADADGTLSDFGLTQGKLAMLFEQTDKFAGDFVDTAGDLANATKIAKSEFTNAAAALGVQLLPIGLKIVQFVSDLVEKFNNLTPAQQKTILIVAGIAAALGPLISIIGGLITAMSAIIPVIGAVAGLLTFPLIAIIAAVIAVIALLYAAWTNNWGGIREKFAAFVAWITPIWEAVWGAIVKYFEYVWAQVKTIWEAFSLLFQGDFKGFGEKLREAWDRAWDLIKDIFSAVLQWFKNINWGQVGANILKGIVNGVLNLRKWAFQQMVGIAKGMTEAFKGFFKIKSDSRLMMEVGQHLAGGLMAGFSQNVELSPVPIMNSMSVAGVGSQTGGGQTINIEINVDKLGDNADINYLAQEVARKVALA